MGSVAQIPTSFGHELRECLRCKLVKIYDQFRESGCENCPFFKMDEDHERVVDCTTPKFTRVVLQDYLGHGSYWKFGLLDGFELNLCEDECVQYAPRTCLIK